MAIGGPDPVVEGAGALLPHPQGRNEQQQHVRQGQDLKN